MDVPVAANVLGTAGAVCWSVQIVVNWRRHHAIGLQPSMMMLWAWAGVPLGVYNIVSDFNIALQIQPQILCCLSLITWIQCYHYQRQWHLMHSLAVVTPLVLFMAGLEVALVYALRRGLDRHVGWPLTLMAALSAFLLATGVLCHYWDIWRHRAVRGISFLFVGIDAAGDLFSLLSVFFQPKLDILGLVIYGTELTLWLGVCAAGIYYRGIKRRPRSIMSGSRSRSGSLPVSASSHSQSPSHATLEGHWIAVESETDANITLHNLPSSTSVFRTVSSDLVARSVASVSSRSNSHPASVNLR